ncbi:mechanosensitive ion channel [Comamonas piscis]|uniref:Mechanosensitive ion channel n=1 Tax=Comamonas piscis TaxID=1562974 RepID=A0A7G5ECE0_9BURK|nr:mechanosensitive ion channel domain-containing protein [Comamonas piscis]QMV71665.1 mechanosensitive ion channel [Comamonas piscis]WSO34386.1 mechanosensitive ion channel domain-containing protein [Comamonas piscis]
MRASPLSLFARQGLPRWWLPALWLLLCACLLSLVSGASAQSLTSLAGLGGSSSSSSSSDEERAIQAQREATATAEQEADALAQSLERLRSRVQTPAGTAPAPLSDQELGQIQARWEERVPANASQEVLEKLLTDEREAIAALKSGIEKSAAEQANLVAQPGNGRTDLATLQQRVQETATPVTAEPGESTALTQARQLRRNAENRRARQELALRQEEQSTIETRQRLLDVQLQTQRRELLERTPRVAWLNQRIADRARQQLEQQVQQTQAAESDVAEAPAAVRDVAQQNTTLAEQILAHNDRLVQERQALASDEYRQSQLASALRDTQARLRLGGSASVGQWLWKQRVALPTVNTLQARRKATLRQLAELRLALFNASERRFDLNGTAAVGGGRSAAMTPRGGVQNTALWTKQAALIDQLQPLLLRRIAVLEQTDAALQSTLKSGSALRQVMDKELLWFPSHLAMGGGWLDEWRSVLRSADPAGLEPSANASPWNTARVLGASILRNLWIYAGIFAGVLLLLGLRRYALQKLQAIAEQVDNFSQDHFGLTLMALGWSLLYALPWSFATAALGVLLQSAAAPVALEPLGQALEQLSAFVFVVTLLNVLFRPCGLAVAHFGWPRERVQVLRQMVLRATWLIVPIDLLGGLAFYSHDDSAISTWGRMCLLVLTLGLAWMAFRYLRQSVLKQRPGLRWSQVVSVAALLVLAITLVGIVLGYVYTATEVIQALLSSFVFLAAAEVLVSLLRRWLLLGERRLALNRLRAAALQRQAANAAAAADAGTGTASNANTNASDEQSQMALVTVSTQAHRLLGLLQRVLVALSLVYAWSPVLPALLRFEGVVLWYTTNTEASGIARPAPVSLMDLLIGALILLMTFSLTRNLPGLVEVVFSSTRRVSSSDRYTMATLARYGITIAGTVSALSLLGLRWSQLQWMAAALTVGLGFGLQEIFANFVSGLILLVERPFRVGDVITINQHTGTVTRIRTRATTVLDFDNQEIVIPNKTFITGQVTNWTLSDDVTRLIIDVSVAHGSDPAEVQRMLLAIAAEHPKVLREPEANCWFMALEGQGQKFELRVYVGAVDDRLPVRNDLNRSINARLKAAGIAVAFPQMDIHVRDLPPAAAAPQEAQGA